MENKFCLNCSHEITKNFCANCGQKADTHRITFKHFIAHDLLHGLFHLERGILFTMKHALVRPGKAALDYISGKRIRYYNVFYLSLILIGSAILISHTGENVSARKGGDAKSVEFIEFFSKNVKFILLGFVPLLAISAKILFRKLRMNLAEHFIAAGFTFVGILIMVNILLIFDTIAGNVGTFFDIILLVLFLLTFLFPVWAYVNLVRGNYTFLGLVWRMIAFYLLVVIEMIFVAGILIWAVTGASDLVIT